jgi:homoserine/homoserine lactone efflux protein
LEHSLLIELHVWLAFVVAASVLLVIPGPTILLVIGQAARHGRRSVVPLVIGVVLGDAVALGASLLGVGAVLAASATLFSLLKWLGVGYLLYLAVRMWRRDNAARDGNEYPDKERFNLARDAFVVTALNPKGITFFIAFLPQFISPERQVVPQLVILGVSFLILAAINCGAYAMSAGTLSYLFTRPANRRLLNRMGAVTLTSAAIMSALLRR